MTAAVGFDTRGITRIDLTLLGRLDACHPQRELFSDHFPGGLPLDGETLARAQEAGLDVLWFAIVLLEKSGESRQLMAVALDLLEEYVARLTDPPEYGDEGGLGDLERMIAAVRKETTKPEGEAVTGMIRAFIYDRWIAVPGDHPLSDVWLIFHALTDSWGGRESLRGIIYDDLIESSAAPRQIGHEGQRRLREYAIRRCARELGWEEVLYVA